MREPQQTSFDFDEVCRPLRPRRWIHRGLWERRCFKDGRGFGEEIIRSELLNNLEDAMPFHCFICERWFAALYDYLRHRCYMEEENTHE